MRIQVFSEIYRNDVIQLWDRCGLLFPGNDPDYDITLKTGFQPGLFFIGLVEERVAASLMAGFDGYRGWLNYLGVDPDFRGKGYGKAILAHAVENLRKMGCPKINLQVRNSNRQVIEFYKKSGFYSHDVITMQVKL